MTSRFENLKNRQPETLKARQAMARDLVWTGVLKQRLVNDPIKAKYGVGVGVGYVLKLVKEYKRFSARQAAKDLKRGEQGELPGLKDRVEVQQVAQPSGMALIKELLGAGFKCVINTDGSMELRK